VPFVAGIALVAVAFGNVPGGPTCAGVCARRAPQRPARAGARGGLRGVRIATEAPRPCALR
jgi:hypothetical protein